MQIVPASTEGHTPYNLNIKVPSANPNVEECEKHIDTAVNFITFFSDITFTIDVASFPEFFQRFLAPILSLKNVKII